MADDITNPLGKEHLDNIKSALKKLDQLDALARKAKLAGFDVEQQMQEANDLRGKLVKVKSAFFPAD